MVQDEVNKRDEPSDLMALDGLNCRREAADKLNRRFEKYLDEPIEVVWAKDWTSKNFDFEHNEEAMLELETGTEVSNGDD